MLIQKGWEWEVAKATELALSGNAADFDSGIRRLRLLSFAMDLDELVLAYALEADLGRSERAAKAYKELTGQEIEGR